MRKGIVWTQRGISLVLALVIALSCPAAAFAAKGEPGRPDDLGPPPGQGNKPDDPGQVKEGDLFGDLWVVVRDLGPAADGRPLYFKWIWPETAYTAGELDIQPGDIPDGYVPADPTDPAGCAQPISFQPLMGVDPAVMSRFTYEPYFDSYGQYPNPVHLIPLDDECKIPEAYEATWGTQVVEVELARLNLARTTQAVIDAAYAEVLLAINSASLIELDPAGRLLLTLDGVRKTVDSPRENMALYQKLMQTGCLSGLSETAAALFTAAGLGDLLVCEAVPSSDDLERAAAFLAGASDKFGRVGVDEVIYLNSILGINTVQTQADGGLLVTGYKDIGNFPYTRSAVYGGTPATLLQSDDGATFTIEDVILMDAANPAAGPVFQNDWTFIQSATEPGVPAYPVMNFVRAADDAVSMIFYIHNFEIPEYPVLPVR